MINTTEVTINNYIEALVQRAELAGDGRLETAMGWLYSTLKALKLQSYELDLLKLDTQLLNKATEQTKLQLNKWKKYSS